MSIVKGFLHVLLSFIHENMKLLLEHGSYAVNIKISNQLGIKNYGGWLLGLNVKSSAPKLEMGPDPTQPEYTFDLQKIEAEPSLTRLLFDPTR